MLMDLSLCLVGLKLKIKKYTRIPLEHSQHFSYLLGCQLLVLLVVEWEHKGFAAIVLWTISPNHILQLS